MRLIRVIIFLGAVGLGVPVASYVVERSAAIGNVLSGLTLAQKGAPAPFFARGTSWAADLRTMEAAVHYLLEAEPSPVSARSLASNALGSDNQNATHRAALMPPPLPLLRRAVGSNRT